MNGIKLLLGILLIGFASCDVSRTLLVNGERSCRVESECGTIELSGATFPDRIMLNLDGNFRICPDSAKICKMGLHLSRHNYRVMVYDRVNKTFVECLEETAIGQHPIRKR